jgi:hypothetical protein
MAARLTESEFAQNRSDFFNGISRLRPLRLEQLATCASAVFTEAGKDGAK